MVPRDPMSISVFINGFGRIGRTVLRQILTTSRGQGFRIVGINDIESLQSCAYLLKYDSVFGPYPGDVSAEEQGLTIDGATIPVTQERDISALDLRHVDVVLECTGLCGERQWAERGIAAGARNVLVSGPSDAADVTVVMGANDADMGDARIVSNASCTTNALAPLIRLLDDGPGVQSAHMTTVHCYTGSQPMVDAPRGDPARSRAGAVSMVPTTTSATKLVTRVLPHLHGRITGAAVRVPAISVSCIDLVVQLTSAVPSNPSDFMAQLVSGSDVIGTVTDPVVSVDMRQRPESVVIALPETFVAGSHQIRVFGWYDNEWGFSARMLDMARLMAAR